MKITRGALSEMIAEEVRRRLRELVEADDEDDGKEGGEGRKKPRKPQTADAGDSPSPKGDVPSGPRATSNAPDPSTPDLDQDDDPDGPSVDGDQPDPDADDGSDEDAVDADGDGGEEPSGAVNDEVSGKTVQAVTIEPKSKVLPGAKEVVVSFNESTDTLRILITPTGQVKFFWRGQLHDIP